MTISVNGKLVQIGLQSITITRLLELQKVEKPDMLSIQLNGHFVDKRVFATTQIKDNDTVDFLYFMGGGSERLHNKGNSFIFAL